MWQHLANRVTVHDPKIYQRRLVQSCCTFLSAASFSGSVSPRGAIPSMDGMCGNPAAESCDFFGAPIHETKFVV